VIVRSKLGVATATLTDLYLSLDRSFGFGIVEFLSKIVSAQNKTLLHVAVEAYRHTHPSSLLQPP
jgi:hypothetical protein